MRCVCNSFVQLIHKPDIAAQGGRRKDYIDSLSFVNHNGYRRAFQVVQPHVPDAGFVLHALRDAIR